jgi:hypothetical protein
MLFSFLEAAILGHISAGVCDFLDAEIVLLYSIISQALGLPGASLLSLYKSRSAYSSPNGLEIIYLSVKDFPIAVLN